VKAPQIAVVGSYATGLTMKVGRLPGTGETVLGTGYRVDYGGKGSNQAVGCARLGANVSFVAKIGKDPFGEMALTLYREERIDTSQILQTQEAPTGVGFIIVEKDSGHNCITIDPGANELLSASDVSAGLSCVDYPAVVLVQLEIPVAAAAAAMASGRACGAITILNPAPVRPLPASVLETVNVLTPNETEARVLAGIQPSTPMEPEQVARELIRGGAKQVVMTLGEKGALAVTSTSTTHVAAIAASSVDTTGAGDAFNAGLAMAMASGANLEDAVRFAVIIGGLAVTKEGVIPSLPNVADVLNFYGLQGRTAPAWLGDSGSNGS
jgi:ribokinase